MASSSAPHPVVPVVGVAASADSVFTTVQDAVARLDSLLTAKNFKAVKKLLRESDRNTDGYIARLHDYLPLAPKYAGRSFPVDSSEETLGGHESELGHIHIVFFKEGAATWAIRTIFMCR